jgi:hypothetical protein
MHIDAKNQHRKECDPWNTDDPATLQSSKLRLTDSIESMINAQIPKGKLRNPQHGMEARMAAFFAVE